MPTSEHLQELIERLDPRVVQQIPRALARRYRILPIAEKGEQLVVLCSRELTAQEFRTLQQMANREEIELVKDSGPSRDFLPHLDELIGHFFPPEKSTILSSYPAAKPGRGRG